MSELSFFVHGVPRPKGSMNSFIDPRTQKIVSVFGSKESRPKLATWNAEIVATAKQAADKYGWKMVIDGPVEVWATFDMPRPKLHFGKHGLKANAPDYQSSKPDIDKLVRTLLDALAGIAFRDDAQVAIVNASKQYGIETGVRVKVEKIRGGAE